MKREQELLNSLEDLLVKEFRTLQSLVAQTKEERKALTQRNTADLIEGSEQKEVILDQLSLIEDSRRMVAEELAEKIGLKRLSSSIADLLPSLDNLSASRLAHLQEGIIALIDQARDLNMGNRALISSKIDCLKATQSYILSFYQSPVSYQPRGMVVSKEMPAVWNMEHCA